MRLRQNQTDGGQAAPFRFQGTRRWKRRGLVWPLVLLGGSLVCLGAGRWQGSDPPLPPVEASPGPTSEDPLAPGTPEAIAHVGGFLASSRLLLDRAPTQPHALNVVYLFPGRAHWSIWPERGRKVERADTFQFGGHAWSQAAGQGSIALEGAGKDAQLLRMELRRAAFLWPDGFAWSEPEAVEGTTARTVTADVPIPDAGGPRVIGSLRATLDAEGRALRIESLGPPGSKRRLLEIVSWQRLGERQWPLALELHENGRRVWRETVTRISTRVLFLDRAFLPVDRRGGPMAGPEPVRSLDLTPDVLQLHPLAEGASWDEALARFATLRQTAGVGLRELGLGVEEYPTFLLDWDGNPTHVVLSLSEPLPGTIPEGWTGYGRRPALLQVLSSREDVDAMRLFQLQGQVPAGRKPTVPYVKFWSENRFQLTLPLEEAPGP